MADLDLSRELARRVEELPTLPPVALKLLAILKDEENSLRDAAKVVQNDAAITARLLRVANSAAFSRGKPITSVFRAVMHLGMRMVAGITIGSCASSLIRQPLRGYEAEIGELWDHSLRAATASREFAFFATTSVPADLAFTAGLLHDIGKSVISEFLAEKAGRIRELQAAGGATYVEIERAVTGTDHAAVGFAVAEHWGLPDPLLQAIRWHHEPMEGDEESRPLIYSVHLGDLIAQLGGSGTGADTLAYRIDENYQKYLQISEHDLSRLLINVETEFSASRSIVFDNAA